MPTRNSRIVIAAWLLFWSLMITIAVQDYARFNHAAYWQPVLWESSSAIVATVLLLTQRRLMRAVDTSLDRPYRWFFLQMAWLPVHWLVFTPAIYGIRSMVYSMFGMAYSHSAWAEAFVYESVRFTLFYTIFVVIRFGALSYIALLRQKEQAAQSERLLGDMQLHRLTQQIQPHFLFNALNTISQLMHVNVAKADASVIQLADVLRATLASSEQHVCALSDELQLAQAYAQLMGERFGERVSIVWDIAPNLDAYKIPVLSMQVLLENIFKHTVEQRRQNVIISVAVLRQNAILTVRLEDNIGILNPTAGKGTGLQNLRSRLQVLHGELASLELTQLQPAGVRAEMNVPCVY